jgi:hypothetical protein
MSLYTIWGGFEEGEGREKGGRREGKGGREGREKGGRREGKGGREERQVNIVDVTDISRHHLAVYHLGGLEGEGRREAGEGGAQPI